MNISMRFTLVAILAAGAALALPASVQAQASASLMPAKTSQASTPTAWCWATRDVEGSAKRTHYFSRVWSMGTDGPTIGFQPQFQSFVSARYSSRGGSSAQCLRFFGRQEAEMRRCG